MVEYAFLVILGVIMILSIKEPLVPTFIYI